MSTKITKIVGAGTLIVNAKTGAFEEIQNSSAFAAIKNNGSVITWGDADSGGDSSFVFDQINGDIDVTEIFSTSSAFAALRVDGSVVTWGSSMFGGDSSFVDTQLDGTVGVKKIYSNQVAFAALKVDGSVVTWGLSVFGGDSSYVESQLNGDIDVAEIFSGSGAFAALRTDGSVVTWGGDFGGNSNNVENQLDGSTDVVKIVSDKYGFAALRTDGSVVTWGSKPDYGYIENQGNIKNVVNIFSTVCAFAALRADGSVVTWGDSVSGGDSSDVASQLDGNIDVVQVFSNSGAFAALRADGSVVTWGDSVSGGDSSTVINQLDGKIDVTQIFSTEYGAFAALRADGSVVTWGDSVSGGDSSDLASELRSGIIWLSNSPTDDFYTADSLVQTAPSGNVTISGITRQYEVLNAVNSLDDKNGLGTINYQWLSNGNIIAGANKNSYTLSQIDVGNIISVKVSYTDGLGKLESMMSKSTSLVTNVNDLPKGSLVISGIPIKGQTLTVSNDILDADGLGKIIYQWLRNGDAIPNATNSTYVLTSADIEKSISVKANYKDLQGTSETVISAGLAISAVNQLSVNSPSINEGNLGLTNLTFTLTLSQALQQVGSVDYTLQSGTATSDVDFTAASGSVQFNAGETSKTIIVPIQGDTTIENDETLNLVLSNPRNLEFSNSSTSMTATGNIRNDDLPTLTVANAPSIQEGNSEQSSLNFTVQLSDAPLANISVDYLTKGLTASAGQDFTTQTGTLKFAAGEKEKTISIPVLGDTSEEPDETLSLVLSNPQNAKFTNNATQSSTMGTILNDDGQSIRISSPSIQEGDSGSSIMKFVVSLAHSVTNDVSFDYKTEEGTATSDSDYALKTDTITIPAGSQSVDIPISILGDTRIEANETVKLTLSNAQGNMSLQSGNLPMTGIGTIIDDDFPVATLSETKTVYQPKIGVTRQTVLVSLNAPALVDGVISYHTENGTALQDKDFISTSGKLTIPISSDSGGITIPILAADSTDTPNETFKLVIDKVEGGVRLPAKQTSLSSTITIADQTLPLLSVQNIQQPEGNAGNKDFTFKASLSGLAKQDVTFTVNTIDKTAVNGQDYRGLSAKTITIPAGTQSIDIPVAILGDTVSEADETFTLELSKITNAVFDSGDVTLTATGTIKDDDKPYILIEDTAQTEGNSGTKDVQVKVTLSAAAATPVTVHYVSVNGTANAGEDFIKAEGDLTIPVGAKEAVIPVSIQGDTKPESDQDFHVVLSNPVNGQFVNAASTIQNTVTIKTDDADNLPQLTVTQKPVDEGDKDTTDYLVTFKLSTPATDIFTVDYQTINVDAKAGSDFMAASGKITFLTGSSSAQITLKVFGDTEVESDEDFTLQLSNPQGVRLANDLPTQDVSLLIQDDDALPAQTLQGTPKNDTLDATKKESAGTGNDSLDGLKGIDKMIGGDGNDTYYVDNPKDSIIEEDQSDSNAGDDDIVHSTAASYTLPANVEHLIVDGKLKGNATGNGLDNKLTGNMAVNVLSGLAGDDTLDGASGNDMLTGGLGNDTFIFSSGIKGNKNIDTIKDFVHGQDKIYLNADIFSKLSTAVGFVSGNEPLSPAKADSHYLVSAAKVKAVDASSYLLYDTKTGVLSYDEDGSGKLAASSFVTLTGKPALTLDDFWIVG